MEIKLTVVIPTYNREAELLRTLKSLEGQFNNDFIIVILDNASEYSIEDKVFPQLNDEFNKLINIIHRKYNIGMNGNLASVIEPVTTDWMWLLGDDDIIVENAINTIKLYIENNQNSGAAWFSILDSGKKHYQVNDLSELMKVQKEESTFNDFIFLSTKLYKVEIAKKYIYDMHLFQNTGIAQCFPIYGMLRDGISIDIYFGTQIALHGGYPNGITFDYSKIAPGAATIINYNSGLKWKEHRKFVRLNMFTFKEVVFYYILQHGNRINKAYLIVIFNTCYKYSMPFYQVIPGRIVCGLLSIDAVWKIANRILRHSLENGILKNIRY